jgi:hypothetical protein
MYWAQWKYLAVKNKNLERHCESEDGLSKIVQIFLPRRRMNGVLTTLTAGPTGGHMGVNKILKRIRRRYYWLQVRNNVEKWYRQCDTCAASRGPRTRNRGQTHPYNVGAPSERIAIYAEGSLLRSGQGNQNLSIGMEYFTKWPETYGFPNHETSAVAEVLVTNFFCSIGVPQELHSDHESNFEFCLIEEVSQHLEMS